MRKLIISLAAALMAAGTVTGATGIAQASTAHTVAHVIAGHAHSKYIPDPTGGCGNCRI
jgi:hypothetical protein